MQCVAKEVSYFYFGTSWFLRGWRKWQPTPVFLPGKIPWTEEPGRLKSMGSQRVGHDWATSLTGRRGSVDRIRACLLSRVWLFAAPRTVAHQAPLSLGFPRHEYWSRLPLPPPGDLPDPGIGPESPVAHALPGRFLTTEPPGKPVDSAVVQSLSRVQVFSPPRKAACQVSLPSPSSAGCSDSCPLMLCSHLVLCHPLLLPSIFHGIRVSSNESALRIRWPKYWSFNFSISPSNEYSGWISFRVDWIKPEDLSLKGFATTIFPIRTHSFLFQHFINTPGAFFHPSSQERREAPDWQGCKKLSLSARDRSSHPLSANHRSTYGPAWACA